MIITGVILLLAFVATVVLIIRGQSPIVMLLLLAIVWSAVAGIGVNDIQAKVLQGGGVAYASAVIIIVFGSWFAQVLIQTGIAETVIRAAAGPHCIDQDWSRRQAHRTRRPAAPSAPQHQLTIRTCRQSGPAWPRMRYPSGRG